MYTLNEMLKNHEPIDTPDTESEAVELLRNGGVLRVEYCGAQQLILANGNMFELYNIEMEGRGKPTDTVKPEKRMLDQNDLPPAYTYYSAYKPKAASNIQEQEVTTDVKVKSLEGYWRTPTGAVGLIDYVLFKNSSIIIKASDLEPVEVVPVN